MKRYIFLAILLAAGTVAQAQQTIAPDNGKIVIEGALFVKYEGDRTVLNRHSDGLWEKEDVRIAPVKANTQSGVKLIFKTDSKTVKPIFTDREGAEHRAATNFYGIYMNGEFIGDVGGAELELTSTGAPTEWEIVLPIMYGVDFGGIIIDDGAKMYKVKREKRPVYIAIGNSITHGAGQTKSGSQISYPYVLAETKGWNLYNLAVGGSQITPAIAEELGDIEADVITVMWGFNDWNATKGDLNEISVRYGQLLAGLRKSQPAAKIYCIMPSTAKNEAGKNPGVPLGAVRVAERGIVDAMQKGGDKNIFIIEGNAISSVDDLNGNVHFTNQGARRFGNALAELIK